MARPLPPEILDLIVGHLCDELATLRACCLVSKSWVPRTQKHLFARINFHVLTRPIDAWRQAFPDPFTSFAHHVRTLSFCGLHPAALTDPDCGPWIRAFRRVVNFRMNTLGSNGHKITLVQLHGFSPTLKSLTLGYPTIPLSEVFNLICSFPLLEDLDLFTLSPESVADGWNPPETSPRLTGSLRIRGKISSVVRRLCDLPGGLHFSKITVTRHEDDVTSVRDLVSRCSDTLQSFIVHSFVMSTSEVPSLDLSKVTELKDVEFHCSGWDIRGVITMVETARSKSLQQITICLHATFPTQIRETLRREWQDLDRLLVHLWTSRSIRPKITYELWRGEDAVRDLVRWLTPELTRRGVVDVVDR